MGALVQPWAEHCREHSQAAPRYFTGFNSFSKQDAALAALHSITWQQQNLWKLSLTCWQPV